jgi:hypothetical protein
MVPATPERTRAAETLIDSVCAIVGIHSITVR